MSRFALATLLFAALLTGGRAAAPAKPNFIYILIDDLGWADLAFHGGKAPTPHIDKLAREGLELTQHYAAPVCTPTRTGLLTGRNWSRFGLFGNASNGRILPWDTVTLPRALKSAGYQTALIGKWHLGSKPEWGPNHFGFDYSYGSLGGGVGPFDHSYKKGPYSKTWHRNEKLISEEGHATDLIAEEAVKWLGQRGDSPFFLYVPFTAVHIPVREPSAWLDKVPAGTSGDLARQYAACIMHLDDAVGRIVAALDRTGRRPDTLIVLSSDNGGASSENNDDKYPPDNYAPGEIPASNLPWRGEKTQLYEGGIRVTGLANWPGKLAPGKYRHPMQIIDWMPTFCALAGYQPTTNLRWDGMNVWPYLGGTATPPERALYTPYGRGAAIREGEWKLIVADRQNIPASKAELFNLSADPGESKDVSSQTPEKVRTLQVKMTQMAAADGDSAVEESSAARRR